MSSGHCTYTVTYNNKKHDGLRPSNHPTLDSLGYCNTAGFWHDRTHTQSKAALTYFESQTLPDDAKFRDAFVFRAGIGEGPRLRRQLAPKQPTS